MTASEKDNFKNVHEALGYLSTVLKNPKRSKTVTVKYKNSDKTYDFKYAPLDKILEQVRPHLVDAGLFISQSVEGDKDAKWLVTKLTHVSGGTEASQIPFPNEISANIKDYGATLSYLKRYGACAALGITADDDVDGNHHGSKFSKTEIKKKLGLYSQQMERATSRDELKNARIEYKDYLSEASFHYPELIYPDGENEGMSISERYPILWNKFLEQEKEVARMEGNYKNTVGK